MLQLKSSENVEVMVNTWEVQKKKENSHQNVPEHNHSTWGVFGLKIEHRKTVKDVWDEDQVVRWIRNQERRKSFVFFWGVKRIFIQKEEEERNETDGNDKKLIGQQTIDTSSIKYKIYWVRAAHKAERRFAQ